MKVSVIIAAYNIENYIERCLISVVNQTFKETEIIVVNDGSKDNTLNIIKNIAKIDNRIVIINQKNKGLIEARKSGLKNAKGEYLLFIDGDDWLEIDALEKLYRKASISNADIILYNSFYSYDNRKEEIKTFNEDDIIKEDPLKSLFLGKIKPAIWAKMIKREYIEYNKIQFPSNISFAEDLATVSSWFMYNPKISFETGYLYNYYQRDSSISKTMDQKVLEVDKAISFIRELLISKQIYLKYKLEFETMVYHHLFETKFISYSKFDCIHKELYHQYMHKQININNNKYIYGKFKKYPISQKIRIKLYLKGYYYGILYDKLRIIVKGY